MKHLGQSTEYRTGTRRQTQPPAAISSQAILIAGVAAWVIPSVIHYEALSLFPAQQRALASLCMTLSTVRQTDIQSPVWVITLLLTMTLSFMCSPREGIQRRRGRDGEISSAAGDHFALQVP